MPVEAKQILEWNQGISGARNHISPLPQLLRALSPCQITPVNYIRPLKNEACLQTTCATDSIPATANYYTMDRQQPVDTSSFIPPPDYYYAPYNVYPSVMPVPPYPTVYNHPVSIIGTEWDQFPYSV